jgi:Xaa-Pro aminopeptidase
MPFMRVLAPTGDGGSVLRALVVALAALSLLAALPAGAQITPEEHAERRAELAQRVGDGVVLAMGSAAPPQDYIPFHQNSPFRYLTGFTEPDAALIMTVAGGSVTGEHLFVLPRDPARETWEGYRVGPEGTEGVAGIPGRSVTDLAPAFDSLYMAMGSPRVHIVGPYEPAASIRNDVTQRIDALLAARDGMEHAVANGHVAELRGVKSPAEIELLRRTIAITSQAHREVMGAMAPGKNEFEMQALVEYTFRRYGSERPAFASIVGSGPNSTILHYNANDRFMEDGDVVVVDIGASYGGYAADVTRTIPVSGRFTPAQREIYQLVRDAQAAAESLARPGTSVTQMSQAAAWVLAEGLAELGLIEAPDATFDGPGGRQTPQLVLFYMHGLGHGIGLDVHDPWPPVLEPGVAFTIEPGIYVRENLFTEVMADTPRNREVQEAIRSAFERYVNIGVRIEDDYVVTEEGVDWLSRAPREIDEIEELMARPWDGPEERNAGWVEWYRQMR